MTQTIWWRELSVKNQPLFTWYGQERVELTGHVLTNWLAKTANFLDFELGAEPGDEIVLDLGAHWRTVLWDLASRSMGLKVIATGLYEDMRDGKPTESSEYRESLQTALALITCDPERAESALSYGLDVYLAGKSALAWRYLGELPNGVEDANAAVLGQPDALMAPLKNSRFSTLFPDQESRWEVGEQTDHARVLFNLTFESDHTLKSWGTVSELSALCFEAWQAGASVVVNTQGSDKVEKIKQIEEINFVFDQRS